MLIYIYMFILCILVCITTGFIWGLKYSEVEILKMKNLSSKHWAMFQLLCKWIKEEEKIVHFISAGQYKKIGIYGMSYMGDCLVGTLRKAGYQNVYGFDKNADKLYNSSVTIYNLKENIPEVDIVIVTTMFSDVGLNKDLEIKFGKDIDIISLENILFG